MTSYRNRLPASGGWQLGVRVDTTDTGLVITNVSRGSGAERAGLQRGDRIIALGTERVGLVINRTVPTRQVLQRQVNSRGEVLLLVQFRSDRRLANVSARLQSSGGR